MATRAFFHLSRRASVSLACLFIILTATVSPVFPKSQNNSLEYTDFKLGMEATDWIASFQITPPSSSWGIPYADNRAWGLDPYYYSNGTITADTGGIKGGERQSSAFLIGGHDAGLGANAALGAYLFSNDDRYLKIFNIYYGYFERSQLPSNASQTRAQSTYYVNSHNETLDDSGYWAEQTNVVASQAGIGTSADNVQLIAAFPAAEHGNPIAATLIAYYRLTHNQSAFNMLNKYGNWLVRTQIKNGEFAGAFPVTQYYSLLGWKPRMYETTESAWILCELYRITGNSTYLQGAVRAGDYMVSRQFSGFNNTYVDGALPYEWNRTRYSRMVSTNHAGFSILAWADLYRLTGNPLYLVAAQRYADWLLNMQVTAPAVTWGDHRYANDSMAIGGYHYGYDVDTHDFGWRAALSLWSAAYAIPALLALRELVQDTRYFQSARFAINWLAKMRFTDQNVIPLQALGTTKYIISSAWGKYPQFYQPDWRQIEKAGIIEFVNNGRSNLSAIANRNLTWFERTFGIDFNAIDYEMASRGPQYMKMIWSWWPNPGFEPRYGADIAFGAFAIANFLSYRENVSRVRSELKLIQHEIHTLSPDTSLNLELRYNIAQELFKNCESDFEDGWYSIATAKLDKVQKIINLLLEQAKPLMTIHELMILNQIAAVTIATLVTVLAAYMLRRRHTSRRTTGHLSSKIRN